MSQQVPGQQVPGQQPAAGVPVTTARVLLETMRAAGVRYLFANLGSDHTAIAEAYALAAGDPAVAAALPELVLCPHEGVALSAAHGYAQVSGQPQAVLVHTDCGTQNLGGAVHNAARGRVPVLILAGLSPMTGQGELPGSRNEFIQWIQDSADQAGIVRGYVKYAHEIRTGRNAAQILRRALQIACSEPAGPVYLTATREVLEEHVPAQPAPGDFWTPVAPAALAPQITQEIASALAGARAPLVLTSYLGRDTAAVPELVRLCELAAIGVIESFPLHVNFPADHPLHWGYLWNNTRHHPQLEAADVILVAGSDVPWMPSHTSPPPGARVYVLDVDPVKEKIPLWHFPAVRYARADLATALRQISGELAAGSAPGSQAVRDRTQRAATVHEAQRTQWAALERPAADGGITAEYLVACVRAAIGPDALVLTEAVTNFPVVSQHLRASRPGSLIGSGASSLGWSGGAAVGAKLAAPGRTVVTLVGDGSYLFGVPSCAQWLARRCGAPSLTVIFDNRGWAAPILSTRSVHPAGAVASSGFALGFEPAADLPGVAAAAGGAHAVTVSQAARLPAELGQALAHVRAGRSAVVSVTLSAKEKP
jgi:acetolactate synthase-1/2/3 large subunit